MREQGKIVDMEGTRAKVQIEPSEACKTCPACSFCRPHGGVRILEVENQINAHIGDEVRIETSAQKSMVAFFLVFGAPVLLGLAGLLLGAALGDVFSVICGIIGFVLGLVCAKIFNNYYARRHFLPSITEILHPAKDLTSKEQSL